MMELTYAAGEHVALLESVLELSHADAFFIHHIFSWPSREQSREAVIEVYEVLCYPSTLGLVRLQQAPITKPIYDSSDLPAEIVGILHAYIHALACLRRVRVNSIAREEYALVQGEVITDSLANLIRSPPVAVSVGELVRVQDLLRRCQNDLWVDFGSVNDLTQNEDVQERERPV